MVLSSMTSSARSNSPQPFARQAPYHLCAIGARHDLKSGCHFGTGIVLVFAGLAISKYLEITSGGSIKKIHTLSRKRLTHKVTNSKIDESAFIETSIENPLVQAQINRRNALEDSKGEGGNKLQIE